MYDFMLLLVMVMFFLCFWFQWCCEKYYTNTVKLQMTETEIGLISQIEHAQNPQKYRTAMSITIIFALEKYLSCNLTPELKELFSFKYPLTSKKILYSLCFQLSKQTKETILIR